MVNRTRVGTTSNLEFDGTYDILIFSFPKGYPNGALELKFTNNPRSTTGVQKVAQSFLYCLLTTKGSDPIRPNWGTELTTVAISSNLTKEAGPIVRDISDAIKDAESQVKILLNSTRRDIASQLESARLIIADATDDGVTMHIRIVTRAGEKAAVAVPFPQTNLEFN